jgi:hypothetical protein
MLAAIGNQGCWNGVYKSNDMIDGMNDGLAQTLLETRHQPQPRIGAFDSPVDGRPDKRLGIAPARLTAPEDRL